MYTVTKTIPHSFGLSVCFRQHTAQGHCRLLHGYALEIVFVMKAETLDDNWVVDFGSFGPVKTWLREQFDHTTLVSTADPQLPLFKDMEQAGLVRLVELPDVSCERFAEHIFNHVKTMVPHLYSVEVREHEGNGAKFCG